MDNWLDCKEGSGASRTGVSEWNHDRRRRQNFREGDSRGTGSGVGKVTSTNAQG